MLRSLERKFKRLVATLLRFVLGSRRIALSPNTRFNRILVIRQHNQLGDMLCAVPLLRALRERFPAARIVLMTSPVNFEVMLKNRYVNALINYDKSQFLGKGLSGWKNLFAFVRNLRDERFDLSIVPATVSTSFTSDLFAYFSGAQTRIGAATLNGATNPSGFFFNVLVELDWSGTPHRHQTLRNLDIARVLELSTLDLNLEITLDSNEQDVVNRLRQHKVEQSKRVIAYHPGAGKLPNRWEASRFARVANTLGSELNASTIITSGPMDDGPASEMVRELVAPFDVVKGKTIREVAAILSTADLLVTNDTGVMHVAAAVGVSVLSLFGPTDPTQWAPIGTRHRYLQGRNGDINNISVEEVLITAREMLSETAAKT